MGYGDEIMITGYAKELKKKYPDHQIVAGNKKKGIIVDTEIFNNNPIIKRFSDLKNMQTLWIDSYSGRRPYFIEETKDRYIWNKKHRVIVGDLYFSENEDRFAQNILSDAIKWWHENNQKKYKKIIFVEPSRKKTVKNNVSHNRNWGIKKWQSFIDIYKEEYLFMQSIVNEGEALKGIFNFQSSFREACAVIKNSDYIVGMEGGFTHATAAVNKKGLFLYGGYIDPLFIGYPSNTNIYINIDGSPCGMKTLCDHCKKCNEIMTVNMISEKFLEMVNN